METIELTLDEQNELVFQVVIEGASGDARVRFILEDKDKDTSFMFPASPTGDGHVRVDLPPMKKMLSEGTYLGKLEVIAEERFFEPLQFNVDFANCVKVQAASIVQVNEGRQRKKPVSVGASATLVEKKERKSSVKTAAKKTVRDAAKDLEIIEEASSPSSAKKRKRKLTESDVRKVIQKLLMDKDKTN